MGRERVTQKSPVGYMPPVGRRLSITVFSDKSRFQLCLDNHRRRVWRHPGHRADPAFTVARHAGSQPEDLDWSVISFDSWTRLDVIRGNLQHNDTSMTF
ncbi:hypothetical protein TNCV_1097421 [Trichonephila clavipes]|nr:hypothetical protein TNCV_1097421 [Trichonephila clavipes]